MSEGLDAATKARKASRMLVCQHYDYLTHRSTADHSQRYRLPSILSVLAMKTNDLKQILLLL
jgi:hypothetical protein